MSRTMKMFFVLFCLVLYERASANLGNPLGLHVSRPVPVEDKFLPRLHSPMRPVAHTQQVFDVELAGDLDSLIPTLFTFQNDFQEPVQPLLVSVGSYSVPTAVAM